MDGDSPMMTEAERRAYRYGKEAPRLQGGMRKSWSNDSLFSYAGSGGRASAHSCVCAPTTHPGSFRCKHHRQHASNLGAAGAAAHAPSVAEPNADADADADAKHRDHEAHEEMSSTDQEKAS